MNRMRSVLSAVLTAATAALAVNVGQTAPAISLSTTAGTNFSLAQQKGKIVVFFFLGCT